VVKYIVMSHISLQLRRT